MAKFHALQVRQGPMENLNRLAALGAAQWPKGVRSVIFDPYPAISASLRTGEPTSREVGQVPLPTEAHCSKMPHYSITSSAVASSV